MKYRNSDILIPFHNHDKVQKKNIHVGLRATHFALLVLIVFRQHLITSSKMILFDERIPFSYQSNELQATAAPVHVSLIVEVYTLPFVHAHETQDLESHFLTPLDSDDIPHAKSLHHEHGILGIHLVYTLLRVLHLK